MKPVSKQLKKYNTIANIDPAILNQDPTSPGVYISYDSRPDSKEPYIDPQEFTKLQIAFKELDHWLDQMETARDYSNLMNSNKGTGDIGPILKEIDQLKQSLERQMDLINHRLDAIEPMAPSLQEMYFNFWQEFTHFESNHKLKEESTDKLLSMLEKDNQAI